MRGCFGFPLFAAIHKNTHDKRRTFEYQPWLARDDLVLEATAADPLGALLSRAMVADKVELEARLLRGSLSLDSFEHV